MEYNENKQDKKIKPRLNDRFVSFSVIFFLIILVVGGVAFVFSMRQIIRANKGIELQQMLDIERLQLESALETKISMIRKMADSSVIVRHFENPDDEIFKGLAMDEINSFRGFFQEGYEISWVNDIDRLVFSTEFADPYWLDADNPAHYWYYRTLYETEGYNLNVNYNPNTEAFKMWVNAPVLNNERKPVGMVALALEVTEFINRFFQGIEDGVEIYLFNSAGEITGAKNIGLVMDNANIMDVLSESDIDIIAEAMAFGPGEIQSFAVPQGKLAIGTVPSLGWYAAAFKPYSIGDYFTPVTALFFVMIIVISLIFVIFNLFIARFTKSINEAMESLESAKGEAEDQKQVAYNALIALEAAQTATSTLFEHAPVGLTIFDENFKFIDCNDAVLDMYGITKEHYAAFFGSALHSPEFQPDGSNSHDKAVEIIKKVMDGEMVKIEWIHCLPNGEPLPVDITMTRIKQGDRYVGLGYVYDMRGQKRMIQNLIDADAGMQQQLVKLNAVVKATKIGLYDVEIKNNDFLDPENTFLFTDELRNMLGYTGEADFPNTFDNWRKHLHPDDTKKAVEDVVKHISDKTGKTPYDAEYRLLRKDGEYAYFRACGEAIRDEDGNAVRIAGALMDITETKATLYDKELQLAKLNLIIETAKIGMVNMELDPANPLSPNSHIVYSDEYKKLLGFTDDDKTPENLGDSRIGLVHPDDTESAFHAFTDHLLDKTGNTPFDIEQRLKKKNGEYAWFRTVGKAIRDPDGNPIRFVNAAFDLTETKNTLAKNELQLAKIALINKVARIGLWDMETIRDDIMNVKNVITYSSEFKEILGYTDESDFPDVISSFNNCLHPDDVQLVTDRLTGHITDLTGKTPFYVEYQARKKNGEYVYIRATGESIRDENGNAVRTLGTIMDISEEKRTLANTEKLRRQAEEANKAKSNFLAHMSHEIRTPMNAVIGAAEIQLRNNNNPPDAEEAFNTIYSSGNLLLSIINDVLDLSKIESGRIEIIPAKYDIPSIIYDTVHINLLRYESKRLDFSLKIDAHTPLNLYGDEMRIKQILNNILSNAFKYSEEGIVELSVSADVVSQTECILILSVRDTGQGMTEEQVSRVFEAYERFNLDINRTIVGTGLGMNITKQLVESMQGEIFVESEPGKGSTFTIRIPQKHIGTEVCGEDLADRLRCDHFKNKTKLNQRQIVHEHMPYGSVLVVDDVETNLYVAKGMLLPYGIQIDTSANGLEAVEKVKNGNEYSIIFMDHMMPKMNGLEATKIIREMGYTHPIIALTANAVTGSSDMFLENGFDGYISKPIDIRELNTQLNRFIRDRQSPDVIESARRQVLEENNVSVEKPLKNAEFAGIVVRNLENAVAVLGEIGDQAIHASDADIDLYTITVHGIKSALANIGEAALSNTARRLEEAGNNKDMALISSETPTFINELRLLAERYEPKEQDDPVELSDHDMAFLREKLDAIKEACETYDISEAETVLNDLRPKAWPQAINGLLGMIAENLLCGKMKEIVAAIDEF
ncbi:MAG: PAS domain-containing protein [Defluviitaleaceae bacterium]|nr:PAS domain-containing protein [Defluviitaleaceae bacterium]